MSVDAVLSECHSLVRGFTLPLVARPLKAIVFEYPPVSSSVSSNGTEKSTKEVIYCASLESFIQNYKFRTRMPSDDCVDYPSAVPNSFFASLRHQQLQCMMRNAAVEHILHRLMSAIGGRGGCVLDPGGGAEAFSPTTFVAYVGIELTRSIRRRLGAGFESLEGRSDRTALSSALLDVMEDVIAATGAALDERRCCVQMAELIKMFAPAPVRCSASRTTTKMGGGNIPSTQAGPMTHYLFQSQLAAALFNFLKVRMDDGPRGPGTDGAQLAADAFAHLIVTKLYADDNFLPHIASTTSSAASWPRKQPITSLNIHTPPSFIDVFHSILRSCEQQRHNNNNNTHISNESIFQQRECLRDEMVHAIHVVNIMRRSIHSPPSCAYGGWLGLLVRSIELQELLRQQFQLQSSQAGGRYILSDSLRQQLASIATSLPGSTIRHDDGVQVVCLIAKKWRSSSSDSSLSSKSDFDLITALCSAAASFAQHGKNIMIIVEETLPRELLFQFKDRHISALDGVGPRAIWRLALDLDVNPVPSVCFLFRNRMQTSAKSIEVLSATSPWRLASLCVNFSVGVSADDDPTQGGGYHKGNFYKQTSKAASISDALFLLRRTETQHAGHDDNNTEAMEACSRESPCDQKNAPASSQPLSWYTTTTVVIASSTPAARVLLADRFWRCMFMLHDVFYPLFSHQKHHGALLPTHEPVPHLMSTSTSVFEPLVPGACFVEAVWIANCKHIITQTQTVPATHGGNGCGVDCPILGADPIMRIVAAEVLYDTLTSYVSVLHGNIADDPHAVDKDYFPDNFFEHFFDGTSPDERNRVCTHRTPPLHVSVPTPPLQHTIKYLNGNGGWMHCSRTLLTPISDISLWTMYSKKCAEFRAAVRLCASLTNTALARQAVDYYGAPELVIENF